MLRGKKKNSKIILISSVALLTCAAVGGYFLLQPGQNQSVVVNNKVDSKTVQEAVDEAKKKSLVLSGEVAPNNSSKVKIDPSKVRSRKYSSKMATLSHRDSLSFPM